MTDPAQACGNCKWIKPILKASENEYFQCGYPSVPKPYADAIFLQMAKNPHHRVLSIGDPQSAYGKDCPTWHAK